MSTATIKSRPHGFTVADRGGRVKVHTASANGRGTVLVFKGTARPKRVHL